MAEVIEPPIAPRELSEARPLPKARARQDQQPRPQHVRATSDNELGVSPADTAAPLPRERPPATAAEDLKHLAEILKQQEGAGADGEAERV